ncbi:hypothetical protein C8Q74DRAFT_377114 [Fomes fomentarius]|nr:hypothetical protein C8Q74DRAFT_377114 [Fomes fomentarius]
MFSKVLDMSKSNTSRVWGFKALNGENQLWIFEQESGGWVIRNLERPNLYIGLANSNNKNNGSELAMVQHSLRIVWEVMVATNGSVRIGLLGNRSMGFDLDKRSGSQDRTHVTIWHHNVNGAQQRWYLDSFGIWNGGQSQPQTGQRTQTPVNRGIYTISNAMFPKVLDMSKSNNTHVWGFSPLNGPNQSWIFEQESGGWVIRSLARPDLYLGLTNRNNQINGSELAMVQYGMRIVWEVMVALNGSVR